MKRKYELKHEYAKIERLTKTMRGFFEKRDKDGAAFEQIDEKGARDMAAQVCKQLGIIRPTKTEAQHD